MIKLCDYHGKINKIISLHKKDKEFGSGPISMNKTFDYSIIWLLMDGNEYHYMVYINRKNI